MEDRIKNSRRNYALRVLHWILNTVFIVFVALRSCDVILWGWPLVLSPIFVRMATTILFFINFYSEENGILKAKEETDHN